MGINSKGFTKGFLIKLLFLLIPSIITAVYFNMPNKTNGIGGGYYDLSLLYYFFLIVPYMIAYGFVIGINSVYLKYKKGIISTENRYILIISVILLILHILYFFIKIK